MVQGILSITRHYVTETAHRLAKHSGQCRMLHGHSYKWQVTVASNEKVWNEENCMVIDFKDLDNILDSTLGQLDHALVLDVDDPLVPYFRSGELCNMAGLICFNRPPTAEAFALWALGNINRELPDNLYVVEVKVWETENSCATMKGAPRD